MAETKDSEAEMLKDRKIRQLDARTARHICSGQVITSLAVAVKELMENAIDAQANSLSIRFDCYYEKIEVIDNGHGIEKNNFELLGKRSCTSKLTSFDDLNQVGTFGFRGEALNSLCNIASVKVHTRHASDTIGTLLTFDDNGNITSREMMPREVGTTVSLSQIFHSLPVRRKELAATYKRAFDQTLSLIYQYCVGSIGLKVSVFLKKNNQESRFSNLFSCNGLALQSNIIEVFDYKQFSNLMPFVCHTDLESSTQDAIDIDIRGFVSKPDCGCGRSSSDRQYFYLNGRPCDLPSASKQINQIYRSFNRNQFPFVLLKLTLDEALIDRNLTPDKRKILLADNHYILKVIAHSLRTMYDRETVDVSSLSSSRLMSSFLSSTPSLKRNQAEDSSPNADGVLKVYKRSSSPCDPSFTTEPANLLENASPPANLAPPVSNNSSSLQAIGNSSRLVFERPIDPSNNIPTLTAAADNTSIPKKHPFFASFSNFLKHKPDLAQKLRPLPLPKIITNTSNAEGGDIAPPTDQPNTSIDQVAGNRSLSDINELIDLEELEQDIPIILDEEFEDPSDKSSISNREFSLVDCNIDDILKQYQSCIEDSRHVLMDDSEANFKAQITPEDNENALTELRHTLTKQSFAQMRVIGQFNLGFIVTKLGSNLFIIDQHASDERINFEKLLSEPKVEIQNLVCPLNLRLSISNEMIVIDHMETFKKLGFGMIVNREANAGHRVLLTRIPLGKEWSGGRSDVEEVIAAIRDSPTGDILEGKHFMLSGLRREIALRACRSSVMIGEALTLSHMIKILEKLATLRDPWHCAHNRPTIRHLLSLGQFKLLF